MAKTVDPNIEKYFRILKKLRTRAEVSNEDLKFYYEYSPEINTAKIEEYVEAQRQASKDPKNFTVDPDLTEEAVIEVGRLLQSDPYYKEQTLAIAQDAESGRISSKLSAGINLVLGGADIATSLKQIRQGDKASRDSRKPIRPAIPQRDILLEQALRQSQENTLDSERALAPARQEIQDNYLNDIQAAKTASTGQAGTFGAYRQLASMNRNRAATQLAPIQDSIRAREQQRTDNLLGMRQAETQQMFQNQASLYPYDLQQYNYDQRAAASLGSTGRANLRDSLYSLGTQAAGALGQGAARRKFNRLTNQAIASGIDPTTVIKAEDNLRGYLGGMTSDDTPNYWEQLY